MAPVLSQLGQKYVRESLPLLSIIGPESQWTFVNCVEDILARDIDADLGADVKWSSGEPFHWGLA